MKGKQQQTTIIIVIAVVAVVAAGALILISGQTAASGINFETIPQSRTDDGAFILGSEDAPITIVEFADYGCPHCIDYRGTMNQLIRDYVQTGKARFEFRTFPTAGGRLTEFAAHIAECVEELKPGSFWQVHELFYELSTSGRYNDQMGRIVAERLGVPYNEVLECAGDAGQLATDVAVARSAGVTGTPAIRVRYNGGSLTTINVNGNDVSIPSFQQLAQVIDQAQS